MTDTGASKASTRKTPAKKSAPAKAATTTAEAPPAEPPSDAGPRPKLPRWRRFLVGFLVVLASILTPVSVLAVWTHNTLLNTDQYVETVGPLAEDPAIQQAVANRVTQALVQNVDIEKEVKDALPAKASFAAPFITDGIERFVNEAALKLIQTQQFDNLWNNANRRAHARLVTVLKGEGQETVSTRNGEVVVNLKPVLEKVKAKVDSLGVSIFDKVPIGSIGSTITLFQSKDLRAAQEGVKVLDTLAIVLPILTVLLFAAAIALSGNRRRTLLRSGLGVAIAMAVLLALFNVGRTLYLDAVTSAGANKDAAEAAYNQILSFLRLSARTLFVVGLLFLIGAWLAGPGKYATKLRTGVRNLAQGDAAETGVQQGRIGTFVGHYRNPLRILVVGVGLVILMVLAAPGPVAVLVIALLIVAGLVLIEFLGRGVPAEEVDA